MFVILNVRSSGKKRIKRGQTVSRVHEYFTQGNQRFYIAEVMDSAQGVNWEEVSTFLGKHRKTVLMDRRYSLPSDASLKRFEPREFRNILLFNTMSMILKELYLSGFRVKVCINDPDALYPHLTEKIVRYAAQTVIVTKNKFKYFPETEFLYEYYGAGITVSQRCDVSDTTLILDTDGRFPCTGKGLLFSAGMYGHTPLDVDGFGHLKALRPSYIDMLDFLGAVHKFNRCDALADAVLSSFLLNGNPLSVSGAVTDIKKYLWKNSESEKSTIFYV